MTEEWRGESMSASDILDVLGLARRSGKIQIVSDGDAYGLHVASGRVIFATSSHRTLRLGHLLLQRGAVQPLYLHDVLRGRRTISRDQALGSVLVRDGAVSMDDLAAGVEEQAIEVISRVLGLESATFMYYGDDPVPQGIEIIALDTAYLVEEAMRRYVQRTAMRVLQRLLPGGDVQLSLNVQLAVVSFNLTDPELLVALHVDRGGATLNRLSAALPLDPMTLKRTIISLMERGYLVAGDPPLRFDY